MTIGAGVKIVQMIKSVVMALTWDGEILHPAAAHPETSEYAPRASSGVG